MMRDFVDAYITFINKSIKPLPISLLIVIIFLIPRVSISQENKTKGGLCIGDCMRLDISENQTNFNDLDIFFEFNEFELSAENIAHLNKFTQLLMQHPSLKVEIQGHTDARGTNNKNIALGEKRAKVVYDYLISNGIHKDQLSFIAYGEESPFCKDRNENCWNQNNRVHFVFNESERK
jgi:outer membrane protein OmpA-like peptidoglycan-associated protein